MPGESTTGAPDWRDAAKLRKFLADDIPQWTPSEGAENTRAFLAALREKCSTEIGAMTGLLLALFEERVDASKAGYELAQKLKRGGGGATPREAPRLRLNCASDVDQRHAGRIRWIEPCARKVWTLPWQPSGELQASAARRSFIRAPRGLGMRAPRGR